MNGAALLVTIIVLVVAAHLERGERRWFEPWSIEDRRELWRALPLGFLAALIAIGMLATAVIAASAPR